MASMRAVTLQSKKMAITLRIQVNSLKHETKSIFCSFVHKLDWMFLEIDGEKTL